MTEITLINSDGQQFKIREEVAKKFGTIRDVMEDIGIEVELDTKPKDLCLTLLEKSMVKDLGKKVPISAYANTLISKKKSESEEKLRLAKVKALEENRKKSVKELEAKSRKLPGCVVAPEDIFSKTLYDLKVDENLGIVNLNDGTEQYSAAVSLSKSLYSKVFLNYENPVLEIETSKGYKGYSRIGEPHSGSEKLILVSPLVAAILNFQNKEAGFPKLCMYLPNISKVGFTFYGNRQELDEILPVLINKIPSVVNAFSYLSLGMVLITEVNGKNIEIRVDKLEDLDETPIFAGLIGFGESDLPFEIEPDL